jgi:hypothetical protein
MSDNPGASKRKGDREERKPSDRMEAAPAPDRAAAILAADSELESRAAGRQDIERAVGGNERSDEYVESGLPDRTGEVEREGITDISGEDIEREGIGGEEYSGIEHP